MKIELTKKEFNELFNTGAIMLIMYDLCSYQGKKYNIVSNDKERTVELIPID